MSYAIGVEMILLRQRKLEEDPLSVWQLVEPVEHGRFEQLLGLGFLGAMDFHFRFDDRHETRRQDLCRHFEMLVYDLFDPGWVGLVDDRAHLGPENALCLGSLE